MEYNKKRKVLEITKNILFFVVLFCTFLGLYHSPFSYFNDSYGLSMGPKKQIVVVDFIGVLDLVYIKSIHFLYLFLGEKVGVIVGYHIFVRMLNCLFLYSTIKLAKKPKLAVVLTLLYSIYPFVIHDLYCFDGVLIAELFVLVLVFIIALIAKAIAVICQRLKQPMNQPTDAWKNEPEEKNIMEREGSLNFLELSDEEIRRNAMIAAGLLPAEDGKNMTVKNEVKEPKEEAKPLTHTQFIENPLPVPKKHVKKEMDYEFPVPEEKMHFDIEEPDKNYFDIV